MHTLEQLRAGELCGARHLKLSENLTEFPHEILSLKETLEVLDLTGNQLSTLPDELAGFGKLRIIFCSENRFTELPEVLGRCPALTMVGFKANRIATVSAKALPAGLRWLILTDNAIERLPDELGQCDALQKLMLAGNRLRELPESLANCRKLELLRIAANRIERFPEWLLSLPRLSWLAYSGNPFSEGAEARAIDDAHVAPLAWETLALGELLGQGASGVIHRATLVANPADAVTQASDRGDGNQVAVKLFKGAVTSDGLPRCEMAASLAAGTHPNLIKVIGKVADHPSRHSGAGDGADRSGLCQSGRAAEPGLLHPGCLSRGAAPECAGCAGDGPRHRLGGGPFAPRGHHARGSLRSQYPVCPRA